MKALLRFNCIRTFKVLENLKLGVALNKGRKKKHKQHTQTQKRLDHQGQLLQQKILFNPFIPTIEKFILPTSNREFFVG